MKRETPRRGDWVPSVTDLIRRLGIERGGYSAAAFTIQNLGRNDRRRNRCGVELVFSFDRRSASTPDARKSGSSKNFGTHPLRQVPCPAPSARPAASHHRSPCLLPSPRPCPPLNRKGRFSPAGSLKRAQGIGWAGSIWCGLWRDVRGRIRREEAEQPEFLELSTCPCIRDLHL